MANFCSECGKPIVGKFCSNCGTSQIPFSHNSTNSQPDYNKKYSKLFKIVSILMIVFGGLGIFFGIYGLLAVAALDVSTTFTTRNGVRVEFVTELILIGTILALISAVIQLIAGIIGMKIRNKPEKLKVCISLGISVALTAIIGIFFGAQGNMIAAGSPEISILIGFIIPIFYLVGAFMLKSKA